MAQVLEYNIKVNDGDAVKSLGTLENELAQINAELKDVGVNSKEFKTLSANAQGLKKEIDSVNKSIEGMTLDKKLETADGAIKVLAGSVQAATGAIGALGLESEAFDKLTAQATNAIAFGTGIKDLSEGFGKLAKNVDLAKVKTLLFSAAQKALNVITTAFNAIMALNPLGLLLITLGAVGALVYTFRDSILNLIKNALGPFKGIIDGIVGAFTSLGEAIGLVDDAQTKQAKRNIELMEEELQLAKAKQLDTIDLEKELLLEKRKLLEEGTDDYKQSLIDEQVLDINSKKSSDNREKEKTRLLKEENEKRLANQKIADAAFLLQQKEAYLTSIEEEDEATAERDEALKALLLVKQEEEQLNFTDYNQALRDEEELFLEESLANNQIQVDSEKKKNDLIAASKAQALNNLIFIAGAETNVGKALIVAQGIQAAQTLVIDAGKTLGLITNKAAESSVSLSTGAANTAAIGFPQNIPLLIGYAAQAAGIYSSIKSAIKSSKQNVALSSAPTISTRRGTAPQTPINLGQAPETNVSNQMVRAYVVAGDVTSTQEANSKLNAKRTLG